MENKLIAKSFMWMFIGLMVTFITGYVICFNESALALIFSGFYIILVILQLALVFILGRNVFKMKPSTAKILFILYSFVTGLTFSSIFIVYEMVSIIYVFLLASIVFGIMGLIGYFTKMDLSKIGTYLMFAIIAIIICSIVNMFLLNDTFTTIICTFSILVFLGMTAWDVQKIKRLNIDTDNAAIYGALELYLDFINIFIDLLRLFGKNRD